MFSILIEVKVMQSAINTKSPVLIWHAWLHVHVPGTYIFKNHIHHTWNIFFIGSQIEELEHSGLARQVSVLLTNHLARATECIGNEAAGTEALQDVLSLLNTLARSRMGRAILSQPACVSKLLSLLLDQRYGRMISGVARLSVWIARQKHPVVAL